MSLYQEFSALLPYLQSVRKLKNYFSFDVSFPNTWKLPKKYVEEDKIMEQQSQNQNERIRIKKFKLKPTSSLSVI